MLDAEARRLGIEFEDLIDQVRHPRRAPDLGPWAEDVRARVRDQLRAWNVLVPSVRRVDDESWELRAHDATYRHRDFSATFGYGPAEAVAEQVIRAILDARERYLARLTAGDDR